MLKGTVSLPNFRSVIPEIGDEMTWAYGVGSDAEMKAGSRGSLRFKAAGSAQRPALGLIGMQELRNQNGRHFSKMNMAGHKQRVPGAVPGRSVQFCPGT